MLVIFPRKSRDECSFSQKVLIGNASPPDKVDFDVLKGPWDAFWNLFVVLGGVWGSLEVTWMSFVLVGWFRISDTLEPPIENDMDSDWGNSSSLQARVFRGQF